MDFDHAKASAAQQRNAVCAKASSDWQGALEDAQRIAIAWYRAQALAHVVQHAPASETDRLVELFDAAASAGKDEYQRVTLPFWLALAFLGRKDGERAEQIAVGILENSDRIVPIGSRAETLKLVRFVFVILRSPRLKSLAENVVLLAHPGAHWRCLRAARFVLGTLARIDAESARELAGRIEDERTARRVEQEIECIVKDTPRT